MRKQITKVNIIPNIEIDVIGEAYNNDNKPVEAVAYGDAVKNTYNLPDDANYVKPETVIQLPEVIKAPRPGPLEAADEVLLFNIDSITFWIL